MRWQTLLGPVEPSASSFDNPGRYTPMNDLDRRSLEVRAHSQTFASNHAVDGQNPREKVLAVSGKRNGTCCAKSRWRILRSTAFLEKYAKMQVTARAIEKPREEFGKLAIPRKDNQNA